MNENFPKGLSMISGKGSELVCKDIQLKTCICFSVQSYESDFVGMDNDLFKTDKKVG